MSVQDRNRVIIVSMERIGSRQTQGYRRLLSVRTSDIGASRDALGYLVKRFKDDCT